MIDYAPHTHNHVAFFMLFKHQTTHQVCRTDALAAKSCVRACWGNPKELQSSGVSGGAGITTGLRHVALATVPV